MIPSLRDDAAVSGVTMSRQCVLFDAERDAPSLVDALETQCPAIRGVLDQIREGIPVPPDCVAGLKGRFFRLGKHYRSICWMLGDGGDVIAFKGTEPLSNDFEQYLEWMTTHAIRGSDLPFGLHFPLVLKMPPGVMPIDECRREQAVTTAVQLAHLDAYGTCGLMPVPIMTFELSRTVVDRYIGLAKRQLPNAAFERVEARIVAGLGVEAYYYPNPPIRVDDIPQSREFLGSYTVADAARAVAGWVTLFARLLHLGYMPYADWNKGWGACFDMGNACIDGGCADLLTLVPFQTFRDPRSFRMGLRSSIEILASTTARLCASLEPGNGDVSVANEPAFISFLLPRLAEAVQREAIPGRRIDPNVTMFFAGMDFTNLYDTVRRTTARGAYEIIESALVVPQSA